MNGSNFCAEWVRCYGGQDIGKERSKHVLVKPDLQYGTARGTLYFSSFNCCRAPFRHSSFSELIFGSLRKDLSLKEGQTITVSWHHFSWSKCAGCAASAGCTNVLRSLRTFEVNLPGKGGRQDALVFLCLPIKKRLFWLPVFLQAEGATSATSWLCRRCVFGSMAASVAGVSSKHSWVRSSMDVQGAAAFHWNRAAD